MTVNEVGRQVPVERPWQQAIGIICVIILNVSALWTCRPEMANLRHKCLLVLAVIPVGTVLLAVYPGRSISKYFNFYNS